MQPVFAAPANEQKDSVLIHMLRTLMQVLMSLWNCVTNDQVLGRAGKAWPLKTPHFSWYLQCMTAQKVTHLLTHSLGSVVCSFSSIYFVRSHTHTYLSTHSITQWFTHSLANSIDILAYSLTHSPTHAFDRLHMAQPGL